MIPLVGSLMTAKMLAIGAAASLVAITAASGISYAVGHSKGVDADKQRSDLLIANLKSDANDRLARANTLVRLQSDALQAQKEKAERDLETEREIAAAWVDSAVAAERVRFNKLAEFASGAGRVGDTVTACRADAAALGVVLDRVLLDYRVCTLDAEKLGGTARTLHDGWPTKVKEK